MPLELALALQYFDLADLDMKSDFLSQVVWKGSAFSYKVPNGSGLEKIICMDTWANMSMGKAA